MKRKWMSFLVIVCCFTLTACGTDGIKNGFDFLEKGEYEKAETAFFEALEEAEKLSDKATKEKEEKEARLLEAEARRGLGFAYYEQQQFEEAAEELERALELGGEKTAEIYNLIGICAMNGKDYENAGKAFEQGIAMLDSHKDKSNAAMREMQYNLVICYENSRNWEKALQAAQRYMEAYPDDKEMAKELEFLQTRI